MYSEERRRQIASLAAIEGRVNVTDLAARFDVTAETIRRDLAKLEEQSMIHRVHGGAVANQTFQTTEYTLDARARSASLAKNSIAQAALDFLPEQSGNIFLDSGTTTSALADLLAERPDTHSLSIVTNSLSIALNLAHADIENIQLLGGNVRAITQAVVGPPALRTLALMRADVAFIGTNALTLDHGLSTADAQEAAIKSAMITNSHKVVVLCDSTKMGTDYLVSFSPLSKIDVIITDSHAPEIFVDALRQHNIEVIVAPPL